MKFHTSSLCETYIEHMQHCVHKLNTVSSQIQILLGPSSFFRGVGYVAKINLIDLPLHQLDPSTFHVLILLLWFITKNFHYLLMAILYQSLNKSRMDALSFMKKFPHFVLEDKDFSDIRRVFQSFYFVISRGLTVIVIEKKIKDRKLLYLVLGKSMPTLFFGGIHR